MLISRYKKSKWLKKDQVEAMPETQRRTVVENVEEDEVGDEVKLVAYFKGIEKGLVLNATNMDVLADAAGSQDSDDFAGLAVELTIDPNVRYQGKRVGGIVLKASARKTTTADAPFDDAIPFGDDVPVEAYANES